MTVYRSDLSKLPVKDGNEYINGYDGKHADYVEVRHVKDAARVFANRHAQKIFGKRGYLPPRSRGFAHGERPLVFLSGIHRRLARMRHDERPQRQFHGDGGRIEQNERVSLWPALWPPDP